MDTSVVVVGGALPGTVEAAAVSVELLFVQATAATSASGTSRTDRLRARMDAA
jgi:hypothetical protein